jgi:hypothetical protein
MTGPDAVLRLLSRLTDRDLQLLDWLADHQVLTTPQIDHALFGSPRFTQRRLLTLHRAGLVDRFRALRPGGGSYPWHHVLAPLGAQLIAATRDQPPPRRAETTRRIRRIATSRTLDHLLGVNQFFTDLAGHARTHPGAALERWWPETRCAAPGAFAPGLISPVRPDGHGIYREHDRRVAFYLEHDTGSTSLDILAGKAIGYATHVAKGGPAWPLLFWLPSQTRESHLRHLLRDALFSLPVATAARRSADGNCTPADPVWRALPAAGQPGHFWSL